MSVLPINESSFESEVVNSDLPVLIDFWAEWCGPCKEISPLLDEISNEMKNKIKIVKINIDENPNIPSQYGVQSIPTLIIFKKGEPVATKVGGSIKTDLISWINDSI
jgi:thioredoxin 1